MRGSIKSLMIPLNSKLIFFFCFDINILSCYSLGTHIELQNSLYEKYIHVPWLKSGGGTHYDYKWSKCRLAMRLKSGGKPCYDCKWFQKRFEYFFLCNEKNTKHLIRWVTIKSPHVIAWCTCRWYVLSTEKLSKWRWFHLKMIFKTS